MRLRFWNLLAITLVIVLCFPASATAAPATYQATHNPTVFINEFHYDNNGDDVDEAVEIAGPAGTDLSGWKLVLYNGDDGSVYNTLDLSGSIPNASSGYGFVVVNTPGLQNGSPDGMALVDKNGSTVQFLSYEGAFTAAGGPAFGLPNTTVRASEPENTPVGYSLQLTGTGTVYSDFTWAEPKRNTFGSINSGQVFSSAKNAPVVMNCGGALIAYQGTAASTEITAVDRDGQIKNLAIASVTPTAPIGLVNVMPAENVGAAASATLRTAPSINPGVYSVTITATSDEASPQTGSCTLDVQVQEILTIGAAQGETTDSEDGLTDRSPYAPQSGNDSGQYVTVRGVIYELTQSLSSNGTVNHGLFIQNTAATDDNDPLSSDGLFVFYSHFDTLRMEGGGVYTPQVGDEVILRGPVAEYDHLTQLSNPYLVRVMRSGVNLDLEIPPFQTNPPSTLADANRYWERHEGMRAQTPAGSIVLSGRNLFASTMDGEVWLAPPSSAIALREDPYTQRAFRDPHPLDDISSEAFDNGNGYRIVLGSHGLKAALNDPQALIAAARTFDTLRSAASGGVYFSYDKYQIMVHQQIDLQPGVDPALNAPPLETKAGQEFSVVTYNLENLYDFRNDPTDGCDFAGDVGCLGMYPPFDYVPASEDAYTTRLKQIAEQILHDLHSPDLLMVQEVEDQDMCSLRGARLGCSTTGTGQADGRPDALEDLALAIQQQGGPQYDSAYDRDGADARGITSAFLFRADRVDLLKVKADQPVLGANPQINYRGTGLADNSNVQNPKALNAILPADVDTSTGVDGANVFTRAPQVGLFRIWRDGKGNSVFSDLYAISNHFSSGPDSRVGQRTEQAAYNAALVAALQAASPNAFVTLGGDLNVYPRPDDPFPPASSTGTSDQLGPLYAQGMINLYDSLLATAPASAYSYVYEGQAQALDQMFVTRALFQQLVSARAAHINADWPAGAAEDGPRGVSDHDPQYARYQNLTSLARLKALVQYYADTGEIYGKNTAALQLTLLDKAQQFKEDGHAFACQVMLQAFIDSINGLYPRSITGHAADALTREALLLRQMH